jgi:hypothetical protein
VQLTAALKAAGYEVADFGAHELVTGDNYPRIMLCSLLGVDVGRFRDCISMPVASISIVGMAVQGPLLPMMGDRSCLRNSCVDEWVPKRLVLCPGNKLTKSLDLFQYRISGSRPNKGPCI